MAMSEKVKEWLKENAPMLTKIYDNKYVEMLYDRYASLPQNQQKQVALGLVAGGVLIVVGYLLSSYWTLWDYSSQIRNSSDMISSLRDYQKKSQSRGGKMDLLEKSGRLAPRGAFKKHLISQGRLAAISPRMLQVEEKDGPPSTGGAKGKSEIKIKQATVTLQRVNLNQLKNFLENVEFSPYNTSISSIKVTNDDQIRGYMNIEIGIVAYLFNAGAGT